MPQSASQAAYPGAPPQAPEFRSTEPGSSPPPPTEQIRPGVHLHDGFYLRMGIGIGGVTGSGEPKGADSSGASAKSDFVGVAALGELALGGAVLPGVVLGVGTYNAIVPSLTVTAGGEDYESNGALESIGPFVDLYPNAMQGFHLQAAITYAVIAVSESKSKTRAVFNGETYDYVSSSVPADDYSGGGFGLMAGIGYEWWVGEQWGVGILARLQYASATLKPAANGPEVSASLIVPGALFTATYQ